MANNRITERRIMCGYSKSIGTIGDVSGKIAVAIIVGTPVRILSKYSRRGMSEMTSGTLG